MRIDLKSKATPIALAVAVSFSIAGPTEVQAQETYMLEEIVVTARKTEESLQDVSLSVSAFTSEDIATRSIEELEDVALYTPGLSFEDFSNGGFGTPTIRGASQISITQLEQNVSTFMDGIYIPRQYAVDIGTMDLERVEVVKGPQSALYGANAFMGAINYVSSTADLDEFSADVSVTFGDNDRRDLSGAVSIPLVPEKLAIRLAAGASEFDGDWDNDYPNPATVNPGTNGKIGGWDNDNYEIDIVAEPIDSLRIDLGYKNFDVFTETKAQSRLSTGGGDTNCGGRLFGGFGPQTTFCGELPETPLSTDGDPIGFLIDPRTYGVDSETEMLTAEFSYDISDQVSFNYLFGNIDGEVFATGNSDRDPLAGSTFTFIPGAVFNAFTQNPIGNFDYDSHELKLEFNGDSGLTGMLGVFLSDGEDYDGSSAALVPLGVATDVAITEAGVGFAADATTETETTAVFGRVAVPFIDDTLVLSVEGRYTDETKKLEDSTVLEEIPDFEDDYFTGRVTLDYNVSDDSLLYVSAAQGVKSGGINSSALATVSEAQRFYGADENTTYEIGSKNLFIDGRLQLNAAAYFIDWSNLQVSTLPEGATDPLTTPILTNIGSAESMGAEIDMTYIVTDGLTLNASLALNDATYDDGTISQRIVRIDLCGDDSCPADGDVGGNSLPRSADTQWSLGAMYEWNISQFDYFVRGDYVGQSEQYVSELNTATIPSRELLNLRAGVSDENWSAELWVKNATDEEYVSNAFYIPLSFQVEYVPTWGNKRRIGLTLDYAF